MVQKKKKEWEALAYLPGSVFSAILIFIIILENQMHKWRDGKTKKKQRGDFEETHFDS